MSVTSDIADVLFAITIVQDLTWRLRICRHDADLAQVERLCDLPLLLRTVEDVARVTSMLEASKLCVGNPDDRYSTLIKRRKGKFTDAHGIFILMHAVAHNIYSIPTL